MLLQSSGGIVHLFPALPDKWKDASFERLHAEGGIQVSAELRNGSLVRAELYAASDQRIRLTAPGLPEREITLKANCLWHYPKSRLE